MMLMPYRQICAGVAFFSAIFAIPAWGAASPQTLSADQVIQRAVARAQTAQANAGQTGYTYTKLTVTEEFDGSGRIKEHKEKVYQVLFQGGTTHLKLLTVNGHPPAGSEMKKQAENESNARQITGSSKSASTEREKQFLTPELVSRFSFKMIGQKPINGRQAYEVAFEPRRPALPAHHVMDRLLDRISGTLWIDTEEFEMAQAEVHLGSEVDLLGGVIGCLKKLAFTMTRTRVGEGVWLDSSWSGDFEGRKLLDSLRIKTKSQSSNFRLLGLAS